MPTTEGEDGWPLLSPETRARLHDTLVLFQDSGISSIDQWGSSFT